MENQCLNKICITKSPNNDKQAKSIKNSSEILHIASNNNQRKLGSKNEKSLRNNRKENYFASYKYSQIKPSEKCQIQRKLSIVYHSLIT